MPLTLADTDTCVVVAGDHWQMTQRVHSSVARELKLSQSIVERLKRHYSTISNSPVSIALTWNYRNHPAILRFLSSIFYGGPDILVPCTDQPLTCQEKPMNFFAAQGEEMQDDCSTSWYNVAEVEEVVTRVMELFTTWPTEWGERTAQSILVTTAYNDQVNMCTYFIPLFVYLTYFSRDPKEEPLRRDGVRVFAHHITFLSLSQQCQSSEGMFL